MRGRGGTGVEGHGGKLAQDSEVRVGDEGIGRDGCPICECAKGDEGRCGPPDDFQVERVLLVDLDIEGGGDDADDVSGEEGEVIFALDNEGFENGEGDEERAGDVSKSDVAVSIVALREDLRWRLTPSTWDTLPYSSAPPS